MGFFVLNFSRCLDPDDPTSSNISDVPFLNYFLPLFPVFTLSTNFPIIAITLCNNLKTLFRVDHGGIRSFFTKRMLFPLMAIIPPIAIAFLTENVEVLVGIVGSYAGASIQYIIPALLVFYARQKDTQELDYLSFKSPFSNLGWVFFVLIWSILCIIFVTSNHIITKT